MNILKTISFTLFLGLAMNTHASIITNGSITTIDGDGDGLVDDLQIAQIFFDVTAGTSLTIDSLVREINNIDLNGDGEITGFDNYMRLFDSSGTLLYTNDDYSTTNRDSIHRYDSLINYNFTNAGTYLVTVGQLSYSAADALLGYQLNRNYTAYDYDTVALDHGDYRLTFTATTGSVSSVSGSTPVPEPSILALIGLGIFGLGLARRRTTK